jgi:manganese/zinc/iron transport system permease protein
MLEALLANPDVVVPVVGALVGVASSLVGTFLVLRGSNLLADAISYSVLLGIVLVYLVTGNQYSPFFVAGAAAVGLLTVFLTELLARSGRVKADAAIGLVYPFLFAIAVVLINVFARNVHIDTDAVLLGEIGFSWLNTVTLGGVAVPSALLTLGTVTLLNALFVSLLYKELKLATFDPGLAAALGFSPTLLYYLLLGLTSVTAVTAFDAVGAVLLVAFIIVPPAAAYLLTDTLWKMLLLGAGIGVASSGLGYVSAIWLNVSIGGSMALCTGLFLLAALLFGPRYGLLAQRALRRRQGGKTPPECSWCISTTTKTRTRQRRKTPSAPCGSTSGGAAQVTAVGSEQGLITLGPQQEKLFLTEAGRRLAQEVWEPWRRG